MLWCTKGIESRGSNMDCVKKGKEALYQNQVQGIEGANHIIMRFSLIFYFVLLGETLLQYVFMERVIWEYVFFWGIVVVTLCQAFLFKRLCKSNTYGKMTLVLFTILFTYLNVISVDNMVLLVPMPVMVLCMLYMDRRVLYSAYLMWGINAVVRFIMMTQERGDRPEAYKAYAWVIMICMVYAVGIYMVTKSISIHYNEVCHNLHHENRLHTQLYRQSTVDTTTGLFNRNSYNSYLTEYKEGDFASISCIYIDVNGLHEYNNSYGHQAGDKMLEMVAADMKKCFADQKHYRIGGDEFVVISENMDFKEVLENLKEFREQMKNHRIHIASGMEWRDENMNLSDMVKKADAKMYQDKECFYKSLTAERDNAVLYEKRVE